MSNFVAARPYALAIYSLCAGDNEQIANWQNVLVNLAKVSEDKSFINMVADPRVRDEDLLSVCLRALAIDDNTDTDTDTDTDADKGSARTYRAFLQVASENKRLLLFADIAEAFSKIVRQGKGVEKAVIYTAHATTPSDQAEIVDSIAKRLGLVDRLSSEFVVEPKLIAGIKIKIEDRVFDQSIAGRLSKLVRSVSVG